MSAVVSSTMTSEIPSMPTRYEMPQEGIQSRLAISWNVPRPRSSPHQSPAERTNSRTVITSAVTFADRSLPSSTGTTPMSGSRTSAWRIHSPYPMDWRKAAIGHYRITARRIHSAPTRKSTT